MKRKSFLLLIAAALFAPIVFSSCQGDEYITQEYYGAFSKKEYLEVDSDMWSWSEVDKRWECEYDVPSLTEEIYDNGAFVASVFVNPGAIFESQEILPFSYTYSTLDNNEMPVTYTETISCTFQKGKVYFQIQTSDRISAPTAPKSYWFKITMFWE